MASGTSKTWDVKNILQSSPIAILILNQPILCTATALLPIWERALIRAMVDGGSNRWRAFEKTLPPTLSPAASPQYVTGDFDSLEPETEAYLRAKGTQFISTPDQDETDFTKALRIIEKLVAEKQLSIDYAICVCEHSGRLDQTIANLETLHHAVNWNLNWNPVILSENSLTWLLTAGQHSIQVPEICVSESLPCGLIPLMGPTTVSTKGLKWNLDKGDLSFGKLVSTSNTFTEREVQVETNSNLIWTMQFQ